MLRHNARHYQRTLTYNESIDAQFIQNDSLIAKHMFIRICQPKLK